MCVVSAISNYGKGLYQDHWNFQKIEDFKDLIQDGMKFDKKTNQPNFEDPAKLDWLKAVEDRLKAIEDKLK